MAIEPNSFEFNFLFVLTIILLSIKLIFAIFLFLRVLKRKRKKGSFEFDFHFAMFVFIICLIISEMFYMYFDFYLTEFDSDKYYLLENVIYYKIGGTVYLIGFAILLFTIDKKVLEFKFKGVFSYILFFGALFVLFYPITTAEEFEFVSLIEMIVVFVGGFIFPIVFLYFGIKVPKLRNATFLFAFGIIVFILGAALLGEVIVNPLKEVYGIGILVVIWIFALVLKIIGLILITYSSIKFI